MKFTSGLPETACGRGSTLETTAHLRGHLGDLLVRLNVGSLLDAPCGDCNWIAQMDLRGIEYTGAEICEDHIRKAYKNAPHLRIIQMDILTDTLPKCDAVLCRDFLQHLPNADVIHAISEFRESGARWLFATSFDSEGNQDIVERGDFRRLNLEIAPISLGSPLEQIEDPIGSGRTLSVWWLR